VAHPGERATVTPRDLVVFSFTLPTRRKETAMEYLPDVYQQFERTFPHVHSAHQDLAQACYEGGP
jgi:hypothetical protein